MDSKDSSRGSHPSLSSLPGLPSYVDLRTLADDLEEYRRSLWDLASSRPQRKTSRLASRARAALADCTEPLHDLARALEVEAIVQLVEQPSPDGPTRPPAAGAG